MNVLIAGGSGLLGHEITNFFSKRYKVYSTYRIRKPKKIKNVVWKKINLENKINWKIRPDIIINCAVTSQFSKKKSMNHFINSNIIVVKNLLDFATKNKTKKIINLSTISVYKLGKSRNIDESSEIDYQSNLSYTKYMGEQILSNGKINFINLRMPAVLNFNLKKNHSWLNNLFFKIKNNKEIKIFNANKKFNSIIHINQLFYLFNIIIKDKKNINGTFNFLPSKGEKLINIILFIKKFFKSNSKIKLIKSPSINYNISSKKIISKFKLSLPSTHSIIKYSLNNSF
jgi:nucleoside-diphosphate-sugar epimerase